MNSQTYRYTWLVVVLTLLAATVVVYRWVTSNNSGVNDVLSEGQRRYDQLRTRAEILSRFAPDSALIYLDSAQRIASTLPDSSALTPEIQLDKASFFVDQAATDTAIAILEAVYSRSTQLGDRHHVAMSAMRLGEIYVDNHKLSLAKPFLEEAMDILEDSGDPKDMARILIAKGVYHMRNSELETAQHHFLSAYAIHDSLQDKVNLATAALNLGSNFMEAGSREEGLRYFHEGLDYAKEVQDTILIIQILNDLGIIYRRIDPDSALIVYQTAIAMIPEGRYAQEYNRLRFNQANIYLDQGDLQSALDTFQNVYRSCKELGFPIGVVVSSSGISEILEKQGDLTAALTWVEEGIGAMRPEPGPSRMMIDLLDQKARLLRKAGKYDQALDLKMKVASMERALTDGEKQIQLLEMEKAFHYERKVSENSEIKSSLIHQSRLKFIILFLFGTVLTVSVILAFLLWQRKLMTGRLERAYHKLIRQYRDQQKISPVATTLPTREVPDPESGRMETEGPSSGVMNLADRLEDWLLKERPFLDPKFRVEMACERLQTNAKALAQALRQYRSSNFNTIVNKARVREAMKLMADTEYAHYKVEFIGYRAGFGTKQTFYTAFEQETGLTPGFYKSSLLDGEPQTEQP